ncbi:cytochrome P450 [Aspergillus stella-maris]|uniref:cytochrome P450 n=1 Tax=Aspergillus stella-maris TaxID=1810926 RepID=UPI003CCD77AA
MTLRLPLPLSPSLLLLSLPPILLTIHLLIHTITFLLRTLRPKSFPPGPPGQPILNNLTQTNPRFPFLSYTAWSKSTRDTPLGIKKVGTNIVVLNSARLVRDLFERRGAIYSDRPRQYMNHEWVYCGDMRETIFENMSPWVVKWRKVANGYFGPGAVREHRAVYEGETARLLVKLLDIAIERGGVGEKSRNAGSASHADVQSLLVNWLLSVPSLGICGRRLDTMAEFGITPKNFKACTDAYAVAVAPSMRDLFPVLRYVPEVFGMAKWKGGARAVREEIKQMGLRFVKAAEEQRAMLDKAEKDGGWESMLARMIKERENGDDTFTYLDLANTATHGVAAAMNTSLSVFEIMLLILAEYQDVQAKVREEVLSVSGGDVPKAADLARLKYTEAFWNEVHRWRPVAPQGVAHAPSRDDIYNDYRIPKGATMIMNTWAIHHNPEDYDSPEDFIPERFLRHAFGMKMDSDHDAAKLQAAGARVTYDFGAGRRICPGMHSAKQSLLLGLAKVLWAFEVVPREGGKIDLSLEGFTQDIALHPKRFDVDLRLREGRTRADVLEHYDKAYGGEAEVFGWKGGIYK